MNPNGRIPTITDDGCILWESNAIIRYLSAKYGEGSLWNPDPAIRSSADRWMEWFKTMKTPIFQGFDTIGYFPRNSRKA